MNTIPLVPTYKPSRVGKVYLPQGLLTWVSAEHTIERSPVERWAAEVSYDSRYIPRDVTPPPTFNHLLEYAEAHADLERVSAVVTFIAEHFPITSSNSEVPTARLKRVLDTVHAGVSTSVSSFELTVALVHVGHRVDLRRDLANPHTSVPELALEWAHGRVNRSPFVASPRHTSTWLPLPVVTDDAILSALTTHRVNSAGYTRDPRTESSPELVAEIQLIASALVDYFPTTRLPLDHEARGYFPGSYGLKHVVERLTAVHVGNGNLILAAALSGYPVKPEDGINAVVGIDPLVYDLLEARGNAAQSATTK